MKLVLDKRKCPAQPGLCLAIQACVQEAIRTSQTKRKDWAARSCLTTTGVTGVQPA